MSILIGKDTHVIVQGITGRHGSFHTRLMLDYGTDIVAGVTPGKEGESVHGVPVYDDVVTAVEEHPSANALIQLVPAPLVKDATLEAMDAGLKMLVLIAEHVPLHDMMAVKLIAERDGVVIVGPNTPGLISPGRCKMGIMSADTFMEGNVGIVSRSGTLTYEVVDTMTRRGIGQSSVVGLGGDPVSGIYFIETLKLFQEDPDTHVIVMMGEIGGIREEQAAEYAKEHVTKSVVGFIGGRTAPPSKRMGHAGAIVSEGVGSAESKVAAFEEAGIPVAKVPSEVADLVGEALAGQRR